MKAVRFHVKEKQLKIEDIARPVIRSGSSEVLVRVAAAGLCRTDLHILDGYFDAMILNDPFTLGHEVVGYVEEMGAESNNISEGAPVIVYPQITCGLCRACRSGDDMRCVRGRFHGLDGTDGGFASYIKSDIRCLIPLPTKNGVETFAPLADAGLTAYHAVKRLARSIDHSASVAVIGVGGLGQIAIQLLRALTPAQIVALDVSHEKLKAAERLGADRTYLYRGGDVDKDTVATTLDHLRKEKINAVLDFVGETETTKLALSVLEKGGSYCIVGYGGKLVADTMLLVASEFKVFGNLVGTYTELAELVEIWYRRRLKVDVTLYPLSDIEQALFDLRGGRIEGRGVIAP